MSAQPDLYPRIHDDATSLALPDQPEIVLPLGRITGEPIEYYHLADALSNSKLKDYAFRPSLYYKKYIAKLVERKDAAHFRVGQAGHTLTLEGEAKYERDFLVMPEGVTRSHKAGKELVAQALFENRTLLSFAEDKLARNLREAVMANKTARLLLSEGEPEVSFRVDAGTFKVQCRTDWINESVTLALARKIATITKGKIVMREGDSYVLDLKTTITLGEEEFRGFVQSFYKLGYHRQGPFYNSVMVDAVNKGVDYFFFCAVEKAEPIEAVVFLPDSNSFMLGWEEVKRDMAAIRQSYEQGVWPGLSQGVETLALPSWVMRAKQFDAEDAAL